MKHFTAHKNCRILVLNRCALHLVNHRVIALRREWQSRSYIMQGIRRGEGVTKRMKR